jgi:hypothetical protein
MLAFTGFQVFAVLLQYTSELRVRTGAGLRADEVEETSLTKTLWPSSSVVATIFPDACARTTGVEEKKVAITALAIRTSRRRKRISGNNFPPAEHTDTSAHAFPGA